ncbi:MAG TPA: Gfo/Idh/MocA family oxidoreductase, partial [Verrucomicrobiae bacterium]|nr:Gfo/Idh/MocA family oxidoreductase [Verrucomicrobiae bacterium]
MKPVGIGVIGCGNVFSAYRAIIEKLEARGSAQLAIACGREKQRASIDPKHFTTNEHDVIGHSGVDLVLILTPPSEHARLAREALTAGKHVLTEKPLATNLPDARALIEVARQNRRHLLCAPFTWLSPTFQTIAARIQAGDIGRPCSARARYGWSGPWWSEWFYRGQGGCIFDLGVYCITSLVGLLGPVKRVTALTATIIPERHVNERKLRVEAEDTAQVLLEFANGALGAVTTGFTMQQYRNPALEVYGTSGVIQMLGDDWDPDGYELWQNSLGAWQLYKETEPDWPWADGLRYLVECIRRGERPIITPEHAFHVLEIMLKARESSTEGRVLPIEST